MERYDKLVLCAEDGMTFNVAKGENGELIIRVMSIEKSNSSLYSDQYVNPQILEGYKHICGEWNNGFTIERISDGSQLVWIPVGWLDSNGTLDGKKFDEKFGRRPLSTDIKFLEECIERPTNVFGVQIDSVRKYGGFYVSRYTMSLNEETGKIQSVKGAKPYIISDAHKYKKIASYFENTKNVKSHLLFGSEYDSILEWFKKTNARTRSEIEVDSSGWGFYQDRYFAGEELNTNLFLTGFCEDFCTNNIYDFTGGFLQMTQEYHIKEESGYIVRGGYAVKSGEELPASHRRVYFDHAFFLFCNTGFRVALWIN